MGLFVKRYGLLGPSGCGKTTLLKSLIGLLDIDGGTIYVDDELRNRKPGHIRINLNKLGFMPQVTTSLFSPLLDLSCQLKLKLNFSCKGILSHQWAHHFRDVLLLWQTLFDVEQSHQGKANLSLKAAWLAESERFCELVEWGSTETSILCRLFDQ